MAEFKARLRMPPKRRMWLGCVVSEMTTAIGKASGMPARRSGKTAVVDAHVDKLLQEGRTVMTRVGDKFTTLRMDDPCDAWPYVHPRPTEPYISELRMVDYRGWEVGFSYDAHFWGGDGWIAYKGGCNLDAPEVRSATYSGCLDAIDEEED